MRRPCWCTKQWQNVAQVLHNKRIKFPKDFFRCCSVHQHGRYDVTWKPRIETMAKIACWSMPVQSQLENSTLMLLRPFELTPQITETTLPVVCTCNDDSCTQRKLNIDKMFNRSNSITVKCVHIAESEQQWWRPKNVTHGVHWRGWVPDSWQERRRMEEATSKFACHYRNNQGKKVISCDFVKLELAATTRNRDCLSPQHDHRSTKSRLLLRRSLQNPLPSVHSVNVFALMATKLKQNWR